MASTSSHDQAGRRTRLQEATEKRRASDQLKEQEEMKRAKEIFASRKRIGPRDIIVNTDLPNIKLEQNIVSPVKREEDIVSFVKEEEDIVSSVKQESLEELSPNSDDVGEIDDFIQTGPLNPDTIVYHNVFMVETNKNSSENDSESQYNHSSQNHIKLLETLVAQKDQEINVLNELIKGLQQYSNNAKNQIGLDDPNKKYRFMQVVIEHKSDLLNRDAKIKMLSLELEKLQTDLFGNTNGKLVQGFFKQVLPLLYPQLNLTDILSLRCVCREWNCATDIFLNTHPFVLTFDKEVHSKEMRKLEFGRVPTWTESPIEKLTKAYKFLSFRELELFSRNTEFQIVGSTVCLENVLSEKPFRTKVAKRFFATFRSRINYLRIRQSVLSAKFSLDSLMDRMKLCFAELPNLKGCTLSFWVDANKIRNESGWDALRKKGNRDYENYYFDSFPKLENLKSLTIQMENFDRWNNDGGFLCKFCKSLVQPYSKQLKQLSIFAHSYHPKYSLDVPNLVQLTMPLFDFDKLVKCRCENVQKCTLTSCNYYLTHMDLVNIKKLFPKLACLGLKFEYCDSIIDEYCWTTETPTFPGVQTLELVNCGAVTYSVLCRFPNLRYINLVIKKTQKDKEYDGDATLHIKKLYKGAHLYDDKVFWKHFPKISVVSLKCCGNPEINMGETKLFTWTRQNYIRY